MEKSKIITHLGESLPVGSNWELLAVLSRLGESGFLVLVPPMMLPGPLDSYY